MARFGWPDPEAYQDAADENVTVITIIEEARAIDRIDEIAATPGIDVLFIGTSDLSFSLGLLNIALAIAGMAIGIRALSRTRRLDAIVFAGAALAGALLATEWSSPIWARITALQYLQFPWRTLFLPQGGPSCRLTLPPQSETVGPAKG